MIALNSNHHTTSSLPSEQQPQLQQQMAGVSLGNTSHTEGGASGIPRPICDGLSAQQYSTADTGEQHRIESNYDSQGIEKRLDQLSRYTSYNISVSVYLSSVLLPVLHLPINK